MRLLMGFLPFGGTVPTGGFLVNASGPFALGRRGRAPLAAAHPQAAERSLTGMQWPSVFSP
ncbi:hypothetical protein ACRAWF_01985 [Streptomyces sp. L7]